MLYIVATPIGNLKDITLRALEVLKSVDLIACEDTRHTKILLNHYQISKPQLSYHSYNKKSRTIEILELLKAGKNIALVSDAGMPGISDPGVALVREAIEQGVPFTVVPGANGIISGLVLSGLPTNRFVFEGFLPIKHFARLKKLKELKNEKRTLILYESCHRLIKTLGDMKIVFGDVVISCIREITKKFEEVKYSKVSELIGYFNEVRPRGEFVIVLNLGLTKRE